MTLRNILLAAGATAFMSMPAWALPGQALADHGSGQTPSSGQQTPNDNSGNGHHGKNGDNPSGSNGSQGNSGSNNQGNDNNGGSDHPSHPAHPSHPTHPSHPGHSHKCMAHNAAYVASGTLLSWTLTKDANANTYSGELEVEVTRTNRHALAGKTKYKVTGVRVNFAIPDTDNDGAIEPDDLLVGDRTHLIGKIATLSKKCSQPTSPPEPTIRKINFHEPKATGAGH